MQAKIENDLEAIVNNEKVKDIILQAEKELRLASTLLKHQAWEPLETEIPPNQWTWPPHK